MQTAVPCSMCLRSSQGATLPNCDTTSAGACSHAVSEAGTELLLAALHKEGLELCLTEPKPKPEKAAWSGRRWTR